MDPLDMLGGGNSLNSYSGWEKAPEDLQQNFLKRKDAIFDTGPKPTEMDPRGPKKQKEVDSLKLLDLLQGKSKSQIESKTSDIDQARLGEVGGFMRPRGNQPLAGGAEGAMQVAEQTAMPIMGSYGGGKGGGGGGSDTMNNIMKMLENTNETGGGAAAGDKGGEGGGIGGFIKNLFGGGGGGAGAGAGAGGAAGGGAAGGAAGGEAAGGIWGMIIGLLQELDPKGPAEQSRLNSAKGTRIY